MTDKRDSRPMVPLEDVLLGVHERMPDRARESVRARVVAGAVSGGRIARAKVVFLRSAAAFTATATLLASTGYAAAGAVPGDLLYPVKRAAEEIQLAFSPHAQQGDALIEMTRERAREVGELIESDAPEQDVLRAADYFGETAGRAVESQPTVEAAEGAVREIEEAVSGESPDVQDAVEDKVPGPTQDQPSTSPAPEPDPTPDPSSGADPQPQPNPNPDPGADTQSESPGPGPGGVTSPGR